MKIWQSVEGGTRLRAYGDRLALRRGFTLIEVLIALVVLVVGIVGVAALFPVAIGHVAVATGDTIAANLAESVFAALAIAHRNTVIPADGAPPRVVLIHDLHPGNVGTGRYAFELPPVPLAENTHPTPAQVNRDPYCHPNPTRYDDAQAKRAEVFVLGNDPYLGETSRSIRLESDPTDPYACYGFKFYVRKVPTVPVGGNSGVYEYTLYVFRVPGRGPLQDGGVAPAGGRYRLDTPPGIETIPLGPSGEPTVPYWILTARISGP